MSDELADLIGRVDGPRPLPDDLRERLSAALMTEVAVEVDAADVPAPDLRDLDAPRPLPAPVRDRLERQLVESTPVAGSSRGRRRWAAAAAAAALAGAAAVTLVVVRPSPSTPPATSAGGQPTAAPVTTHPAARPPKPVNGPLVRAPRPSPTAAPVGLQPKAGKRMQHRTTSGSPGGSGLTFDVLRPAHSHHPPWWHLGRLDWW